MWLSLRVILNQTVVGNVQATDGSVAPEWIGSCYDKRQGQATA